jgi:hypothetical protein
MVRVGRIPEGKLYTVKTILSYFTGWKTALFTLVFSKSPLLFPAEASALLIPTVIQPFGSQPATSFVFWLKAHNKPGKPHVYTVAQIVSFAPIPLFPHSPPFPASTKTSVCFKERVPYSRQCFYRRILPPRSLGLKWPTAPTSLANNNFREPTCDRDFRLISCDARVWAVLASGAFVYLEQYWG